MEDFIKNLRTQKKKINSLRKLLVSAKIDFLRNLFLQFPAKVVGNRLKTLEKLPKIGEIKEECGATTSIRASLGETGRTSFLWNCL